MRFLVEEEEVVSVEPTDAIVEELPNETAGVEAQSEVTGEEPEILEAGLDDSDVGTEGVAESDADGDAETDALSAEVAPPQNVDVDNNRFKQDDIRRIFTVKRASAKAGVSVSISYDYMPTDTNVKWWAIGTNLNPDHKRTRFTEFRSNFATFGIPGRVEEENATVLSMSAFTFVAFMLGWMLFR